MRQPLTLELPKPVQSDAKIDKSFPSTLMRKNRIRKDVQSAKKPNQWNRGDALPMTDAGDIDYERLPWHVGAPLRMFDPWVTRDWEKEDGTIDYAEMPMAEALTIGYGNFPKSATTNLKEMYMMLKTPLKSADILAQIGTQTGAKVLSGMIKHFLLNDDELYNVMFKDPDSQLVDMVIEVYKQNYSLDDNMAGLKRYIAEEPASFAEDISMLATIMFAGTGAMAGRAGRAAFKLTPHQKSLLKFSKKTTGRAPRISEAISYLTKHTPDALKWYGDRAYYIGVGTAAEGYAPGYWAKLAHMTLNYMDPGAWPLMAPADLIQGTYRFMQGDLTNAAKFDDSIDEFAEYLHDNFKDEAVESHEDFREFVNKVRTQYQSDADMEDVNEFLNWVMNGEAPNLAMPMPSLMLGVRVLPEGITVTQGGELMQAMIEHTTPEFMDLVARESVDFLQDDSRRWSDAHIERMLNSIDEQSWDDTILSHVWQDVFERYYPEYSPDYSPEIPSRSQTRSPRDTPRPIPSLPSHVEVGDWMELLAGFHAHLTPDEIDRLARESVRVLHDSGRWSNTDIGQMLNSIDDQSWNDTILYHVWHEIYERYYENPATSTADRPIPSQFHSIDDMPLNSASQTQLSLIYYVPEDRIHVIAINALDELRFEHDLGEDQYMDMLGVIRRGTWSSPDLDELWGVVHNSGSGRRELQSVIDAAERERTRERSLTTTTLAPITSFDQLEINTVNDMKNAFIQYLPDDKIENAIALAIDATVQDTTLYDDLVAEGRANFGRMRDAMEDKNWASSDLDPMYEHIFQEMSPMYWLENHGVFKLNPDDAMKAKAGDAISQRAEKRSYGVEIEFLADEVSVCEKCTRCCDE